jgi:hypothetical protein
VAADNAGEDVADEEEETEEPVAPAASALPAPAAPTTTTSAGIAAPTGPVWGGRLSFAEKLKRAEAEKARLAALPKGLVQTAVASPLAPAAECPINDVSAAHRTEPAASSPAPAFVDPAPSAPTADTARKSLGKWEAPVEASEIAAFQPGSFDNAYDESANNGAPASVLREDKSTNDWRGPVPDLDMSGGLFSQQASAVRSGLAKANAAGAAKASPGTNKLKDTNQQALATAAPAQTAAYAQSGYTQPPGMRSNVNTGAALNAPAAAPAGVYPYPGFDLSQAQFGGYPQEGAVPPASPAAKTAASTASSGTFSPKVAGAASETVTPVI